MVTHYRVTCNTTGKTLYEGTGFWASLRAFRLSQKHEHPTSTYVYDPDDDWAFDTT
jgi:hypothetical protein